MKTGVSFRRLVRAMSFVFSGGVILNSLSVKADEPQIALRNSDGFGVSPQVVIDAFLTNHGIELDYDTVVKVSSDEEGNGIEFETLDHLSVVVPHSLVHGPFNKVAFETEE